MDPLDLVKVQELLELTGGDRTWVVELLGTYVTDTRRRLADLDDAVRARVPDRIQREAHGIKGSSGSVGATRMAGLCQEVETCARAADLPGAAARLDLLREEFERVRDAVSRLSAR